MAEHKPHQHWDERHAAALREPLPTADPFIAGALERLAGPSTPERELGRALDLACGTGRHALIAARLGWAVRALDYSPVALQRLRIEASSRGLLVATLLLDLESLPRPWTLGPVDLLVCCDYLQRELFEELPHLLAPGGAFVCAGFTSDWPGEHPSARYRLEPGELARACAGLEPLESFERGGRAGWCGRRRS
jgi:tellurite methyltransferase